MRDHRHPHEHRPGARPPWWPEGETFPPASRDQWRAMRGHFFRRIAIGIGLFFLFVFLIGWLGAWFGGGGPRHLGPRERLFPGFLFFLVPLVVGFVAFGSAVRRTAGPIGDVMDAAARVAEGDLSARAPVQGPSEVRDLAAAFNRMAERLEVNEEQRRNLLADVAHELRTPLTVIQGRVEGMADGIYPSDREHLALIEQETKVMSRLLEDLQLLSNAEAGALQLNREAVEPRELIESAVAPHRSMAAEAGVDLGTEIPDGLPILVADPVRVGEVLSNLITNALRHTPASGAVTVAASRTDAGVAFAVRDTGEGIPAEQLPHVFDRFAKSPASRGAGLGLAIAKSLVEAHGGTISAESQEGGGTTIRFVLPLERAR